MPTTYFLGRNGQKYGPYTTDAPTSRKYSGKAMVPAAPHLALGITVGMVSASHADAGRLRRGGRAGHARTGGPDVKIDKGKR